MSTCTCTWEQQHGLGVMIEREPSCEQHGDGSPWWRRMKRRALRQAAKDRHPSAGTETA